jgi:hypothetical protein
VTFDCDSNRELRSKRGRGWCVCLRTYAHDESSGSLLFLYVITLIANVDGHLKCVHLQGHLKCVHLQPP